MRVLDFFGRMAEDSFSSVPVIDVSSLLHDLKEKKPLSAAALGVCDSLHRACQDVGFFYVSHHGVSKELQSKLEAAAKVFFNLPEEQKAAFSMEKGGRAWRGWFKLGDELTSGRPDQKEGYYFGTELSNDHPLVLAKTPMHGPNLFPDEIVKELRPVVLQYMAECRALAQVFFALSFCCFCHPVVVGRHFCKALRWV